ncbi:MAG: hypothetical protein N3D11_05510 [Candidatus Sumerlaeia bacterium]|nr:hypothetical protein [Candidatus Sumerlaeia bacterium]
MRQTRSVAVIVGVAALGVACATPWSLSRAQRHNEELQQQVHRDILTFYENMAQAYWVLAYDCFLLSEEAQAAKNEALAQQYAKRADMYKRYSEDLKASLRATQESLSMTKPVEAASETAAPANPPAIEPGPGTRPFAVPESANEPVPPQKNEGQASGKLGTRLLRWLKVMPQESVK